MRASRPLWLGVAASIAFLGHAATAGPPPGERTTTARPHRSTSASGTYLPILGPMPLRLLRTNSLPLPHFVLPPLLMSDPAPPTSPPKAGGTSDGTPPILGPEPPPLEPPVTEPGPPFADPLVNPEARQAIVTPAMLTEYFRPAGSNFIGGAWSVPVFIPPTATGQRSSSATYRSQ